MNNADNGGKGCAPRRAPRVLVWLALVAAAVAGPARAADEPPVPSPVKRTGVVQPTGRTIPPAPRPVSGQPGMFDAPGSGAGTVLLPELDPITLTPTAGLNLSTGSESASFPRSRGRATSPSADDAAPLPRSGLDVTSPVVLAVMGVSIVLLAAAGWYALRRN